MTLDEFESHPYVNLRVWAEIDGAWYPVKGKGCSIRLRELVPLADALRAVATALDRDRPRPVRATLHQARRERVESPRPLLEGPPRDDFDEFGRHS